MPADDLAYSRLLDLVLLTTATCIISPQSKQNACLSTEQDFYSDSPRGTTTLPEQLLDALTEPLSNRLLGRSFLSSAMIFTKTSHYSYLNKLSPS